MSIRSSGIWCDVCNNPILWVGTKEKAYQPFKVSISPTPMDACNKCAPLVKDDIDFESLPEGPMKQLMRRAVDEGVLDPMATATESKEGEG